MTVPRVKTSTGWVDLVKVGPQGPPGPPGPPGGAEFLSAAPGDTLLRSAGGDPLPPDEYHCVYVEEETGREGSALQIEQGRIAIPEDGLYLVGGVILFGEAPAGTRGVRLASRWDDRQFVAVMNKVPELPGNNAEQVAALVSLPAGESVELQAFISDVEGEVIPSGTALTVSRYGSGSQGVPGPPGPEGPPGAGVEDLTYVHTQGTPSDTWMVVHNLGRWPSVEVVDTGGSVVIPSVRYIDVNTVELSFGSPTTGKAYVN